jgi:hypothetical protein
MSKRGKGGPRQTDKPADPRQVIAETAKLRVAAAWACVGVLRPDLRGEVKKAFARKILGLSDGIDHAPPKTPAKQITPAQVESIIWENMQCINGRCPMLLFSKQIAEELNQFFREGD